MAGLPPVLAQHLLSPAISCLLGKPVSLLVSGDPHMGWHPEGRDLVVPADYSRAILDCGSGEKLARANSICPDSVDGRRGACEGGVAVVALLPLVEDPQRAKDGIGLCVEHLQIIAQVEAAARPHPWGSPAAYRLHPSTAKLRAVGPNRVSACPAPGRLDCRALLVDGDSSWEGSGPRGGQLMI